MMRILTKIIMLSLMRMRRKGKKGKWKKEAYQPSFRDRAQLLVPQRDDEKIKDHN